MRGRSTSNLKPSFHLILINTKSLKWVWKFSLKLTWMLLISSSNRLNRATSDFSDATWTLVSFKVFIFSDNSLSLARSWNRINEDWNKIWLLHTTTRKTFWTSLALPNVSVLPFLGFGNLQLVPFLLGIYSIFLWILKVKTIQDFKIKLKEQKKKWDLSQWPLISEPYHLHLIMLSVIPQFSFLLINFHLP